MSFTLVIAQAARTDLAEIWSYVAEYDVDAADRVVDAILAAARRIADWPEMGRTRPELLVGIRSFAVGPHLLFYRVRDTGVELVRVVDGRRDLDSVF